MKPNDKKGTFVKTVNLVSPTIIKPRKTLKERLLEGGTLMGRGIISLKSL